MKQKLYELFSSAVEQLKTDGVIPQETDVRIAFERSRAQHGDYATNLAMVLSGPARRNPQELAELIRDALPASDIISRVEIAGPGFINLFVEDLLVMRY